MAYKSLIKTLNNGGGGKWSPVALVTAWEKVRKNSLKYEQQKI
jgi:hypothetical protein